MTSVLADVYSSSLNEAPSKDPSPMKRSKSGKSASSKVGVTSGVFARDIIDSSRRCQFCRQSIDDENVYGKFLEYQNPSKIGSAENEKQQPVAAEDGSLKLTSDSPPPSLLPSTPSTPTTTTPLVHVHLNCALFSSGLSQSLPEDDPSSLHGFDPKDITAEYRRARRLQCATCKERGASIGCGVEKCKKSYHLQCCSKDEGVQLHFGSFPAFCHKHRPRQTSAPVTKAKDGSPPLPVSCAICVEDVIPSADVFESVWMPCCNSSNWLHRSCLQQMAFSAGRYFFKCPLCADKKTFQKEMLKMGISVPIRDASWETSNLFEDLYSRPFCCAKVCKNVDESGEKQIGVSGIEKDVKENLSADKSADKPADKSGDKSADKCGDKSADQCGDKSADKCGDKPADKSCDKPAESSNKHADTIAEIAKGDQQEATPSTPAPLASTPSTTAPLASTPSTSSPLASAPSTPAPSPPTQSPGRYVNNLDTRFELMNCDVCGSKSIHLSCGELSGPLDDWACPACTAILAEAKIEAPSGKTMLHAFDDVEEKDEVAEVVNDVVHDGELEDSLEAEEKEEEAEEEEAKEEIHRPVKEKRKKRGRARNHNHVSDSSSSGSVPFDTTQLRDWLQQSSSASKAAAVVSRKQSTIDSWVSAALASASAARGGKNGKSWNVSSAMKPKLKKIRFVYEIGEEEEEEDVGGQEGKEVQFSLDLKKLKLNRGKKRKRMEVEEEEDVVEEEEEEGERVGENVKKRQNRKGYLCISMFRRGNLHSDPILQPSIVKRCQGPKERYVWAKEEEVKECVGWKRPQIDVSREEVEELLFREEERRKEREEEKQEIMRMEEEERSKADGMIKEIKKMENSEEVEEAKEGEEEEKDGRTERSAKKSAKKKIEQESREDEMDWRRGDGAVKAPSSSVKEEKLSVDDAVKIAPSPDPAITSSKAASTSSTTTTISSSSAELPSSAAASSQSSSASTSSAASEKHAAPSASSAASSVTSSQSATSSSPSVKPMNSLLSWLKRS